MESGEATQPQDAEWMRSGLLPLFFYDLSKTDNWTECSEPVQTSKNDFGILPLAHCCKADNVPAPRASKGP